MSLLRTIIMTNNQYAPLPSEVEPAESSLPLYSKDSHLDESLQLDEATSNPVVDPPPDLSQTLSGRRFVAFKVVWQSPGNPQRTMMCELGHTRQQTIERLRLGAPNLLGEEQVENMIFQIPAGDAWTDVADSDWHLVTGQTHKVIRVELVTKRMKASKVLVVIIVLGVLLGPILLIGTAGTLGWALMKLNALLSG